MTQSMSVLFSRGSGDIFQRRIHHAVTKTKLKRNTKMCLGASKWISVFTFSDRFFSCGEARLINTDFGYDEAGKKKE